MPTFGRGYAPSSQPRSPALGVFVQLRPSGQRVGASQTAPSTPNKPSPGVRIKEPSPVAPPPTMSVEGSDSEDHEVPLTRNIGKRVKVKSEEMPPLNHAQVEEE